MRGSRTSQLLTLACAFGFGTKYASGSDAGGGSSSDPHAFMWSNWDHHEALMLDVPPTSTGCSGLSKQDECAKFKDCGWLESESRCYFAADPDYAPVTPEDEVIDAEPAARMLRGDRKLQLIVPSGGCLSIKNKGDCGYYNGCFWVNGSGCFAHKTPSPTPPITSPPTAQIVCSNIKSSGACSQLLPCAWQKKNGNWACRPKTEQGPQPTQPPKTPKPTKGTNPTPKENGKEACYYPGQGCSTFNKDRQNCILYNGCTWNSNKCNLNKKCSAPPPAKTPPPSILDEDRPGLSDMCVTPPGKCESVPARDCEKYTGCYVFNGICSARKCDTFDCAVRQLAFDFSSTLLPRCTGKVPSNLGHDSCASELKDVHDGLELFERCGLKYDGASSSGASSKVEDLPGRKFYVSDATGNDQSGNGNFVKPYKTIQRGVQAARSASGSDRAVIIRGGTYHITDTIVLTAADSGLTIAPYENEKVVVSGAIPLTGIKWASHTNKILVADVSKFSQLAHLSSVFFDDAPATRARHPNADPWRQGLFTKGNTGYFGSAEDWVNALDNGPNNVVSYPDIRPRSSRYRKFNLGYGGHSSIFTPPASYWAVRNPVAGGGCMFELPRGVQLAASQLSGINSNFQSIDDAYVHAYHIYLWGNWIFRVGSRNGRTLMFQSGGFQEARGSCGKGGGQFYIENMLELLDAANEFYLDTRAKKLYYFPNATSANPNDMPTAYATVTRRLFHISGSSDAPVRDVVITGLQLEKTYATHMDPHEVPSAGDWSVTRNAAVFIEGGENIVVHGNSFLYMGGNGVFVSNYARNVKVTANRFKYLGASAVLVVGDPRFYSADPWNMLDPNHPFDTVVEGNIMSEIGNVVKQSAGFFQALGRGSLVQSNVIFNSERTAVNFNDGYGGDNKVFANMMFNTVRSTIDHGPFNTWDRQPYFQAHPGSGWQVTGEPMLSYVKGNYLLGGYGGIKGIDHDDGSTLWENSENLLVYGYQKLKGRDQNSYNNVVLFPMDFTAFLSEPIGIPNSMLLWHDNKLVTKAGTQPYGFGSSGTCPRNVFRADNNEIYVGGTFWANCNFGSDTKSWSNWVGDLGQDKTSSIKNFLPSTPQMLQWGYDILGLSSFSVK